MAKLAIPEIGLNKAARAVAGWSPCTHEQRSSSGFRVCRGAIWPKFRPAAFAKALRHSCRAAFAALRGLNLGSNQQSHYFQTLPSPSSARRPHRSAPRCVTVRATPRTPVSASSRVTGRILAAAALVAAARVLTRLRRYRLAVTKIHPSLCDYLSAMCSSSAVLIESARLSNRLCDDPLQRRENRSRL